MNEELLSLQNITVCNFQAPILSNIHFQLNAGEIHAIIGTFAYDLENFINYLAGKFHETSGQTAYLGNDVQLSKLSRNDISFISQDNSLFGYFSIAENIYIKNKDFYRKNSRNKNRMAIDLGNRFNFDIDIDKSINNLTTEEIKMIELLRTFVIAPNIIVLQDTINLVGNKYIGSLMNILNELKQSGIGIIYITKKFEDAFKYSDRISVLDQGRIKGCFDTCNVRENPREVICLLSGWENSNHELDSRAFDVYDTIILSREIMTSSFEIKNVINTLAKNYSNLMHADGCIIYLFDEINGNVIHSICSELLDDKIPKLTYEFIQQQVDKPVRVINSSDEIFDTIFQNNDNRDSQTMVGVSVLLKTQPVGYIQFLYNRKFVPSKEEIKYVEVFRKEIEITIETSRLLGKSVLLQESHHRIKNNLQVIINLIYMQKSKLINKGTSDLNSVLDEVINRIKSIAEVHDLFASNDLGNNAVNLRDIVNKVLALYDLQGIDFSVQIDPIGVPYNKVTYIALIINELLSNCVKHAFPNTWKNKKIEIFCASQNDAVNLIIHDTGVGMPDPFKLHKDSGMGTSIINAIVSSLGGTVKVEQANGLKVSISLPISEMYN